MGDKKIVLFYADWCGHCTTFKPEWEKFENEIKNSDFKNKISVEKYESAEKHPYQVEIKGYPTIKVFDNDKGQIDIFNPHLTLRVKSKQGRIPAGTKIYVPAEKLALLDKKEALRRVAAEGPLEKVKPLLSH